MTDKIELSITYGMLADSITEQLKNQNLKFDKKVGEIYDMENQAINVLCRGSRLLNDNQARKLRTKLHHRITKHVERMNTKK
jgi:ferritin-like metal-binding protein YciE